MMKKGFTIILALLLCLSCGCRRGEPGGQMPPELEAARDQALTVAEQYRDVYEGIFSPGSAGLFLTESETGEIIARFEALGYAAVDSAGRFPLTNPALVENFFAQSGALSLYEICTDGVLSYEYDLPGNPPGTSHDGHVDTLIRLPLG